MNNAFRLREEREERKKYVKCTIRTEKKSDTCCEFLVSSFPARGKEMKPKHKCNANILTDIFSYFFIQLIPSGDPTSIALSVDSLPPTHLVPAPPNMNLVQIPADFSTPPPWQMRYQPPIYSTMVPIEVSVP